MIKLNKMKEPIEMKAGDERVLVNGLPLPVDYRIVWEENYKELKRAFDLANVSNQRELLLAFAGWLYGNLDKEVEERIVDDYLNSK
jgi:hypothetical protein